MFENNLWITLGLTTLLIALCTALIVRELKQGSRALACCYTAVAAGGISNLVDRLTAGYVTDMFSFGTFAIFNVADIAVVCGCCLAVLVMFREGRFSDDE